MTQRSMEPMFVGRSFDDFLFRPQRSVVASRRGITLSAPLAGGLHLELPILSANMDSVTGREMARAMALEGGLGVLHRGQSIERQAEAVTRVKRIHGAVIANPLRLPRGTTIRDARAFARANNVTGILIEETAGSGVLAGLLSHRDMPWMPGHESRPVDEFMTPLARLHTHPPGISEEEAERILFDKRIERLPLVDAEHCIHGLITRKDILFLRQRPFASKDQRGRLLVAAAIGAAGDYLERAAALVAAGVDCLVVDIAHGHSEVMARALEALRGRFDALPLICGNVATGEGAAFLAERGADAVKVGVGPGRGCRTRLETAAGVAQLQAIREAWCAVGDRVPIVADGGVANDKDLFLALICGASTVMLGSALSGTDESPGHVIEDPATHTKRKIYRGMTSPQAVFESLYDAEGEELSSAFATPAEGQEVQVAYKGSVVDILGRIRGHLQSAVSYAGETSLAAARAKVVAAPASFLTTLSSPARRESYER